MWRMRMRWSGATAAVLVGSLLALPAPAAAAPTEDRDDLAWRLGIQLVPKGSADLGRSPELIEPNPFLSLVPDPSSIDLYSWKASSAARSAARAAEVEQRGDGPRPDVPPLVVEEEEPDGVRGVNDTPATSQVVPGFGSRRGEASAADVRGTLAPGPEPVPLPPAPEDNGSIPLAAETGLRSGTSTRTTGTIGDGPHGSAGDGTGDADFYAVRAAAAGQRLVVDIDTDEGGLDSLVVVWDAEGVPLAGNDDGRPGETDSYLSWTVPAAGDYFVSVSDLMGLPEDPFDSGSGVGVGTEGDYAVTFGLDPVTDVDVYAVRLRHGDVLSGSVAGSGTRLAVYAQDGDAGVREVFGSSQDVTFIYPQASPLTGGGNAVVDHVADVDGLHYVATEGMAGDYSLTLEVYRPGPDLRNARQTIFLDFDGERVNTGVWGGPGVRQLSPLSAFVTAWGIPAWQEGALIDRIVATTTENLRRDFARTGVRVRILNSRDHADPFGRPHVTRVVVGGTIAESGVPTIGIAQSIDPGNFEMAETGLVLLDLLSASADEEFSLNAFLRPGSDRLRFVGTALGNVVAHEAGHMLGNWHVDQFNETANLMDAGGNFAQLFGVGPDGVGGTADDPDVDFGVDQLNPIEGFTGWENTWVRTRWALTP
ncbi:PPC domain-containing protein [Cellulomonas aerilata]|uniref:Peptidase C-terminal archaeal/bacterial domain-containing protein n=1 Tax=Cellulomonas aerilata TaxID=515326 RepID=A0A512DCW6_9CELL|nr:PPC domain-containing protein [Cellulomonas aerilata]GEO34318.1 hypothetical protein CAE01nite_20430 [Cellulomonas aerilata]